MTAIELFDIDSAIDELIDLLPPDQQPAAWSIESFAGEHRHQLAAMVDRSNWIHLMCARQSGKTWADLGILLDNAQANGNSLGIFLGLKGTAVKLAVWVIWKRLLDSYAIERTDNETSMLSTFPNGARVVFGGTDDLSNVKKFLGNRLDNSVFIIDESQDQPDAVLRYILQALLPPMCTPTTRVIVSGVLPDVPAGYFYELAAERPLAEAPELQKSKGFSHHVWGRADNVHTPEAMAQLRVYMAEHGLDENDPQIQRDWFMRRAWVKGATAYGYELARNGYNPQEPAWFEAALVEIVAAILKRYPDRDDLVRLYSRTAQPPGSDCRFGIMAAVPRPGIEYISCAIDQGRGDRFSIEVNGWGRTVPKGQHLFEFATPRNTALTLGQAVPVMRIVQRHYGPGWWFMDGVQNEIDTFAMDHGITAIKAPNKQDAPGQIKRSKDFLQRGMLEVMIGSALEQDLQKAKRDTDAQARRPGAWSWASAWHPDPSEAWRYSLGPYFDAYEAPDKRTQAERELAAIAAEDMAEVMGDGEGRPDALSVAVGWH
jgi:hypothetical protein